MPSGSFTADICAIRERARRKAEAGAAGIVDVPGA